MSEGLRACPLDGFPMILDLETARTAVDAGWPAVELYRCANGHSHREWPAETPRRRWHAADRPCAVCGRPLTGVSNQKYHPGVCASVAFRERARWNGQHPGQLFVLERARWYRGPLYHAAPLPPLDPLAGRMPRDWAVGWGRSYGEGSA